ncbi:MAG TPA: hypothetical protein VGN05_01085 [Parvibaculum sp.]
MAENDARIEWSYTTKPEFFMGADATSAEKAWALCAAAAAPVLLYALAWRGQVDWALWQWALAVLLAIDIAGGVVANALSALKRLTFSPPNPADGWAVRLVKRRPLLFPLAHVHPLLLAWAFGGSAVFGAVWYAAPILSHMLIHRLPLYLHRPAALGLIAAAFLVSLYVIGAPRGFEWFAPLFMLKLVYGHAVREEPYAPPSRRI